GLPYLDRQDDAIRHDLWDKFGYAIPNDAAIDAIVAMILKHGPIVEVGAGLGFWARLVRDRLGELGMDPKRVFSAYDEAPGRLWSPGKDRGSVLPWTEVEQGDAAEVARKNARSTLMMIWPPENNPMGFEALKAYGDAGGQHFIYVGETPREVMGDR